MTRFLLCLAAAVCLQISASSNAQGAILTNSEDFRTSAGGTGVKIVDSASGTTMLSLSDPGSSILDVIVSVNISRSGTSIDSNGNPTGGGFTFNRETVLRLTSPGGSTVNLVNQDSYSGQNSLVNQQTLNFDDAAATAVGGPVIVAGTFRPVGSLSDFDSEDATGNWTLFYQDTVGLDPLSVNDWSIRVETQSIPEPASIAVWSLLGFVGIGCGWRRKRSRAA